ncbi:MAG: HAD-IA family hydrolase [Spirochaetia bacterium]|jgi:beta-phosphoglucomutase|nr:HAD-IA family hydrolase [Spirochaetia bacterium]
MIKGVLFDMDGVIVDSEEFIRNAAILMFKELGLTAQHEDFFEFIGAGEDRFLGGVAEKYNFTFDIPSGKVRTYEIYSELIKNNLKPLPGVHSFIKKCRDKGLKIAMATSADRTKMESNLIEIGISEDTFDAVVTALDVSRQKPFPDIYLKAASLIGEEARDCLVVEDAINGVNAAKTAGAKCLGLTTSFSKEQLYKADWFADNLSKAEDEVLNW